MVMWPIIEMCGPVARVGLFFVNTAKSLQSHASRMTRERTLPGQRTRKLGFKDQQPLVLNAGVDHLVTTHNGVADFVD